MLRFFLPLFISTYFISFTTNKAEISTDIFENKSNKKNDFDISYSIEPYYDINVFRFIVIMEFKGDKSGETRIILPGEYGGNNNIQGIKNLKPLSDNTYIYDTNQPEIKLVKHNPNADIKIYYQVEEIRRGDVELGNHYMVVLKKQYFHFLGETFFIIPDWDSNSKYRFRLAWNHMPSNWNLANSFGVNQKIQSIILQLWKFRYSIFTGGDFRIVKRSVNKSPVYFSIKGNWLFTDDQIADLVQSIIKEERGFWNDYDYPFYLITIFPIDGGGDQGGTGRTNSYALFLSADRKIDYRLKRVVAHETFHTWIGDKITFSNPEQLLYWFKEGFTEYYARLLLLRANLISIEEYAAEYNKVLEAYYTSSFRYEKNVRLVKDFWSDVDLMMIPYQRGDIFAHNLNTAILNGSQGKKSLDDLMREILKRCTTEDLVLSTGSLTALIRYYTDDNTVAEIMRTLNSGAQLKVNPNALGSCFKMEINSYKRFWLIGEQYNVPVYKFKSEDLLKDKTCIDWFNAR